MLLPVPQSWLVHHIVSAESFCFSFFPNKFAVYAGKGSTRVGNRVRCVMGYFDCFCAYVVISICCRQDCLSLILTGCPKVAHPSCVPCQHKYCLPVQNGNRSHLTVIIIFLRLTRHMQISLDMISDQVCDALPSFCSLTENNAAFGGAFRSATVQIWL